MFGPLLSSLFLYRSSPSICMMETYFWQWAPETQFLPCRYPAASFILHPSVPLLLPVYLPACIFYPSPCATSCVLSNLCPPDWLFWGQGIVQSVVPSPFLSLKTTVTTLTFCSIFILGNFLHPLLGMSPNAVCSVNCSHLTLPSPSLSLLPMSQYDQAFFHCASCLVFCLCILWDRDNAFKSLTMMLFPLGVNTEL